MGRQYIKSPLNYTGGKYKLLNRIIPEFPNEVSQFVDLFAGGLNVGINVDADTIYVNDQITYLIELYRYFQNTDTYTLLEQIKTCIKQYELSIENAEGYNNLRYAYNANPNPLQLFVLICYSFNHQIRFNNSHQFNTSFGKRRSAYNSSIENNLVVFCEALHRKNIVISSKDFRDFDFARLSKEDMVYCDPPYILSNGSYNDGKRGFKDWDIQDELDLMSLLDTLDSKNIKFALSNVLYHKGNINTQLKEWAKKYNVIHLDKDYSNCSYHLKDRNTKTVEVLIVNYEK
ncbi:Dam family site-specific DNA-(adenine-N6)-methyltransferase [Anaerovoracaceae bacterium 41-7]